MTVRDAIDRIHSLCNEAIAGKKEYKEVFGDIHFMLMYEYPKTAPEPGKVDCKHTIQLELFDGGGKSRGIFCDKCNVRLSAGQADKGKGEG